MVIAKRIPLLGIMLLTLLVSCSDNPAIRLRYEAERMYHHAEKLRQEQEIRPDLISTDQHRQLADLFGQTSQFCYNALESIDQDMHPVEYRELQYLAYQAASRLSQIFYRARRFDTCVAITNRVIGQLELRGMQAMTSYINLGKALQGAGEWDSAMTVYRFSIEKFYPPVDDSSQVIYRLFNIPFHSYYISKLINDTLGMVQHWRDAESYYAELADKYPETKLSYAALGMLARLYDENRQFDREIRILRKLESPTDTVGTRMSQMRIADLYSGPLNRFDSARAIYNRMLNATPVTDSTNRPRILFKLSQLDLEQKDFPGARRRLLTIEDNYPLFYENTPAAQLTKAVSFEGEGNWTRAEAEYQLLIEKFRSSDEALASFLYLGNRFKERGREAESEYWYNEGEKHYKDLAQRRSGTIDEARALGYEATLLQQKKKWGEAAEVLTGIYNGFPDTQQGHKALLSAAHLYRERLKSPEKADSLLNVLKAALADLRTPEWE
jgi:tetratricopeptide (TPR) repeat protein